MTEIIDKSSFPEDVVDSLKKLGIVEAEGTTGYSLAVLRAWFNYLASEVHQAEAERLLRSDADRLARSAGELYSFLRSLFHDFYDEEDELHFAAGMVFSRQERDFARGRELYLVERDPKQSKVAEYDVIDVRSATQIGTVSLERGLFLLLMRAKSIALPTKYAERSAVQINPLLKLKKQDLDDLRDMGPERIKKIIEMVSSIRALFDPQP